MPARRRLLGGTTLVAGRTTIEPEMLDYLIQNGAPREDETHTSTVVLLLLLRRGSCPVAPELGNRMFEELQKLGDGAERQAEAFAREALLPLTRPRAITDLQVTAPVVDGRLCLDVDFKDKDGRPRSLRLPIARGA